MIALLFAFLVPFCAAQEVSTDTPNVPIDTQIEISNLGKSVLELFSGRYRQTGKPIFAGGFCFPDGTCQLTAPVTTTVNVSIATGTINIPQTTGTNTTFAGCNIAGSSVTAVGTTISTYVAHVEAAISSTQNAETIGLIALMNGSPPSGFSAGMSNCITQSFAVNGPHHMSCDFIFHSTSTLGNTWCLGARDGTSGGTWKFYQGATGDAIHGNTFEIRKWGP